MAGKDTISGTAKFACFRQPERFFVATGGIAGFFVCAGVENAVSGFYETVSERMADFEMTQINKKIENKSEGNFFLGIFKNHIISIVTIISTVFGGSVVFAYLDNIGYLSLFPAIISSPSVLVVIILVAFSYLLVGGIGLFFPYALFLHLRKNNPYYKRVFFNSIFNTLSLGACFFCILFYFYEYLDDCDFFRRSLILVWVILPIFTVAWWGIKLRYAKGKNKKWNKVLENGCYLFVCYLLTNVVSTLYGGLLLLGLIGDYSWLIFFVGFVICFNIIIANSVFYVKKVDDLVFWILPFVFLFIITVFIGINGNQVSEKMLYPVRFVERPSDASWYLLRSKLNNDNTAISEFDLQRIQKAFHCVPGEGCSLLYKNHRLNALYGYMAWNVGETRILCPKHIELDKLNKDKCLVIESKYLQPMNDGQYIDVR